MVTSSQNWRTMIDDFTGEYHYLSNFYKSPMMYSGVVIDTVEHGYQAMKTLDLRQRADIFAAPTPGAAKRMGRRVGVRDNWDEIKFLVMWDLLQIKFHSTPSLRTQLQATGDEVLIEGNTWGDEIWGCTKQPGNWGPQWVGQNWLGRLLMLLRRQSNDMHAMTAYLLATPGETRAIWINSDQLL